MKNAGYIHVPSFRFCYQSVLNFQLSNLLTLYLVSAEKLQRS